MNTAKKTWVSPKATLEEFTPNEYVSACVEGQIACYYPGTWNDKVDDGTNPTRYGPIDHKEHGLCGNWATISFNGETGKGYEYVNGVAQKNRPISGISYKVSQGTGTFDKITWQSTDGADTYYHEGQIKVTNIIEDRPNHS